MLRTVDLVEFLTKWPNIDNPNGFPVYVDINLYDIPATVTAAVRNLAEQGVAMVSVANVPQVIAAAEAGQINGLPRINWSPALVPFAPA